MQAFLYAEVSVQALESLFSAAAGLPFRVSLDDPDFERSDYREAFAARVGSRADVWRERGMPRRAARFEAALRERAG